MKKTSWVILAVVAYGLLGCAQVPRESLQISQTLGRDLVEVQRAHLYLVGMHFDRLEYEVDKFVRNVYAPYQIQISLADEEIGGVLIKEIVLASSGSGAPQQKNDVVLLLAAYLEELQMDVSNYREDKLAPLRIQRRKVVEKINEAYSNMQTANAATTGYLSSVIQVRDAQNELLERIGAPNLQNDTAQELSRAADAISKLSTRVVNANSSFNNIQKELDDILKNVHGK